MTRLFTDGAESGDALIWTLLTNSITSVTTARIGGRSYQIGNGGTSTANCRKDITASSEIFARFAFNFNSVNQINGLDWQSSAGTVLGSFRVNTSQLIELRVGATLSFTGTEVLSLNTWYLIEVHIKIADSGGVIEYKLDGILNAGFSGDTKPGSDTTIAKIAFHKYGTFSTLGYVDDIAINDIAGGVDDTWCGDAHIYGLAPNADGDSSVFVGSDGNSTNNYLLVDEIPTNSDTDYVTSATSGDKDLYNLASIATLPAGSIIKRVVVEARAREITADADSINLGVKSGSTEGWSGNLVQTTSYTCSVAEFTTNPATSAAWTESEINSLQIGVKLP